MYLWSANQYTEVDLLAPNGAKVHYVRSSPGVGFSDAVYSYASKDSSAYFGSTIVWNGQGWDLKFKNGMVYVFGALAPLQEIRDRLGNRLIVERQTVNEFGSKSGMVTRLSTSEGRWITFGYDAQMRITSARDNLGRIVGYTYDANGRLWQVTDIAGDVTTYTYDAAGRMETITDPKGIVFLRNAYDSSNRVISQTLANDGLYLFSYLTDGNSRITQTDVTDPRGKVRRVTFDSSGKSTSDVYPVGSPLQQSAIYTRSAQTGLTTAYQDSQGRVMTFAYDGNGNMTQSVQMAGTAYALTTTMSYILVNGASVLQSTTDPLGRTTTMSYDAQGNVTQVTNPQGQHVNLAYNAKGLPISITDPLSRTSMLSYGVNGSDLVSVTDSLGDVHKMFSDAAGRNLWNKSAQSNAASIAYDDFNLPVRITDTLGNVTTLGYDDNSNLTRITDPRGSSTRYGYDSMDRVISMTDALANTEYYAYNVAGQITQTIDRRGQVTTMNYDDLGRVVGKQFADSSVVTYTFDASSRLTKVEDSVSGTISRTYDVRGLMTSESTALGSVGFGYDVIGRMVTKSVSGQTTISYTYDSQSRLSSIAQGASVVGMFYDAQSRPISMSLPLSMTVDYGYDGQGRLINMVYKRLGVQFGDLGYGYDNQGRRVRMTGSLARVGLPQTVAGTNYNAANQLTSWNGATLTYDANGNMISDGTSTFVWNARNQLSSMTGAASASFVYDTLGRRISKTVNGVTTQFLYDGDNVAKEIKSGQTANVLMGGTDQLFSRTDAAGQRTMIADGLGSVLGLVDQAGSTTTSYTYDAFGGTTASGAESDNANQYTSRENDGTGLYFYRARYYSARFGRFISEDPARQIGSGINWFAYADNNPVINSDPSGLKSRSSIPPPPPPSCQVLNSGISTGPTSFGEAVWTVGACKAKNRHAANNLRASANSFTLGWIEQTAISGLSGLVGGVIGALIGALGGPVAVVVGAGLGGIIGNGYGTAVIGWFDALATDLNNVATAIDLCTASGRNYLLQSPAGFIPGYRTFSVSCMTPFG